MPLKLSQATVPMQPATKIKKAILIMVEMKVRIMAISPMTDREVTRTSAITANPAAVRQMHLLRKPLLRMHMFRKPRREIPSPAGILEMAVMERLTNQQRTISRCRTISRFLAIRQRI